MEKRLRSGILLGFVSMGADALVSLVSAPLLLRHLDKAAAGTWMIFVSLGAMLLTLQMGMVPTLTRSAASLPRAGDLPESSAWWGLRRTSARAYTFIVGLVAVVALLLWPLYLVDVDAGVEVSRSEKAVVWTAYVLGLTLRLMAQRNFSFLNGCGEVGLDKVATTVSGVLNLGVLAGLVFLWRSLAGPALAFVVSGGGLWATSRWLLKHRVRVARPLSSEAPPLRSLFSEGFKLLVLNMTSYVVCQSCLVLMERSSGAAEIAKFAPILRVTLLLIAAATLPQTMMYPYLARCWQNHDALGVRRYAAKGLGLSGALFAAPALVFFCFAESLIGMWLGPDNFIGQPTVGMLMLYGFLYVLNVGIANPVVAGKRASFLQPAILNMVLVVPCMMWAQKTWGVAGFPIGMLIATFGPVVWVAWISFCALRDEGIFRTEAKAATTL